MTAAEIARQRQGKPAGEGWLIRCPVPSHGRGRGDRSPSCLIRDGEATLLVRCFAGCSTADILAALRADGGLRDCPHQRRGLRRKAFPKPVEQPIEPHSPSLAIWRAAQRPQQTLVEDYLVGRAYKGEIPPTIRYARTSYPPSGITLPAMVTVIQAPDRRPIAVHLTFLNERGRKAAVAKPKLFPTGARLGGGAARLAPVAEVIGLAEGIEDALSAMALTGMSAWAACGVSRLASVELPREVRAVHLFAQNDALGSEARKAVERAADLLAAQGRRVVIRRPSVDFKDWNDWLRAGAPETAS